MVILEDEAKMIAAHGRAGVVVHAVARLPADGDVTGVRWLQKPGDMKKRRLAGPRRPDEGDDLARVDGQIDPAQDFQVLAPLMEGAFYPG